jgi:hypothetical protein
VFDDTGDRAIDAKRETVDASLLDAWIDKFYLEDHIVA